MPAALPAALAQFGGVLPLHLTQKEWCKNVIIGLLPFSCLYPEYYFDCTGILLTI